MGALGSLRRPCRSPGACVSPRRGGSAGGHGGYGAGPGRLVAEITGAAARWPYALAQATGLARSHLQRWWSAALVPLSHTYL